MIHLLLAVIYLAFVSLGLPDSLLGSAWPSMYGEFGVPVSYAGAVSMTIAAGTVVSSLLTGRLARRLGPGLLTALSVALTSLSLYGFSTCRSFPALCLWAVPYGLGAGSVDAALNNYVAAHYASRHMSWLHCMWGLGAALGPHVIARALSGGGTWSAGYRTIAYLQAGLTAALLLSLPLWRRAGGVEDASRPERAPSLAQALRAPGARAAMAAFFAYCSLEQTAILWGSSYLALYLGFPAERAARYAGLFFLGITGGRALSGFLTMKLDDVRMVRLGLVICAAGTASLLLGASAAPAGLVLVGLGCAPVYPCLLHATPDRFGPELSQTMMGLQMASAYVGICLMPPLFGLIAAHVHIALFPAYLLASLLALAAAHETLLRRAGGAGRGGAE